MRNSAVFASFALCLSGLAFGSEAQKIFDEALTHYQSRERAGEVELAISGFEKAASLAEAEKLPELQYRSMILAARAYNFSGILKTVKAERLSEFEAGMNLTLKARALAGLSANYADSYFVHGLNLARWAETKGVAESVFRRKELETDMKECFEKPVQGSTDRASGEMIDGYGPSRVLGIMNHRLGILGNRKAALAYLKNAYDLGYVKGEVGKRQGLNVVYYAEALWNKNFGAAAEKQTAKEIINEFLVLYADKPLELDTTRPHESQEEVEQAKKLRASMN